MGRKSRNDMSVDGNVVTPIFAIEDKNRFTLDESFIDKYRGREPKWGPVGEIVFLRTYSRKIDGRQERFWETCRRVVEGTFSAILQSTNGMGIDSETISSASAEDMYDRMFNFKFLAPGRGMSFMGTKAVEVKGSGVLQNCGFVTTENIDKDFPKPFCDILDLSCLGVGMGFDTRGANKVRLITPVWNTIKPFVVEDTREGWVEAVRVVMNAFVGKGFLPTTIDYSKVRPAGAPLKTLGGTSSGPEPLAELLNSLVTLLNNRIGRYMSSVDIVDVANMIGKCVVSGNIRRSSELALGDPNDSDFVNMKDPSERTALYQFQREIAAKSPEYEKLKMEKEAITEMMSELSVLDPRRLVMARMSHEVDASIHETLSAIPEWKTAQDYIDSLPLSKHRWASNNSVVVNKDSDFDLLAKSIVRNGEPGIVDLELIRSRGRLSDPPDDKDAKVMGLNPCGEQPLEGGGELCTLVEVFPTHCTDLEDFKATLRAAWIYGKAVTLIPTHRAESNAIMQRNRRIGVSLAGSWAMYENKGIAECIHWWRTGFDEILSFDDKLSKLWNVTKSTRHTTIKPGGSVPLLCGIEGGLKSATHRFGFRTVRMAIDSPLIPVLKEANYRVEVDVASPRTYVVYFPIKSDSKRVAKDVSMREQLELTAELQKHWSDNGVSVTVMFQPHEAENIAQALRDYSGKLKAVSFLPLSDHQYVQAPYIEISESEYENYKAQLLPLPNIYNEDTKDSHERFCNNGVCELPLASSA